MLQKWKRKGKRFRHVEKDGEETTELSVKIQAAKFRDLPMSLRILIVNLSLFLILCAVFFMAGAYLYAPQAAGRNYVEACLAGDWNSAYDVCQFPDSTFLSRKNYVNAMTWKAKQDGTDGQETPEIKSFFMRRKQNLETGENRIYTVRYTLKGMSDSQEETLEIAAGDTVKWNFKEWYVVPKDSCVTDVEITVPADASFYLDGVQVGKKYLKETADNVSIYKIPYLFLGGHTIELTEKQKDPYREIVLVQDNSSMEFLPDLKLNDSTGKTIADRAEESLDKVFTAAAAGKSFSTIKNEFSADTAVQKTAKEQYQQLCDADLQHQRQRRAPYARRGGHRPCAHRDRDSVRPERRGADHPSARAAEKRRGRARAAAHLRYPRRRRRPLGRGDAGPPARQPAVQAADPGAAARRHGRRPAGRVPDDKRCGRLGSLR